MGCDQHEISILICNDRRMKELNRDFRGMDRPTNVLSFPEKESAEPGRLPDFLGDVAISLETAQREADVAGISLSERLSQLLVHGILHLMGYDHERSAAEEQDMTDKSLEILKIIEPEKDLPVF